MDRAELKKKLMLSLILTISTLYIISIILSIFGVTLFKHEATKALYENYIVNNLIFIKIISLASIYLNLILILGISKAENFKSIIKIHLRESILFLMLAWFCIDKDISSILFPLCFLLIVSKGITGAKPLKIAFLAMAGQVAYQPIILLIKLGHIPDMNDLTFYQEMEFNIDQYLFMGIMFIGIMRVVLV